MNALQRAENTGRNDCLSGDRESLTDLHSKVRADGMEEEWIEFAVDMWKSNTRQSECAKDSVRNPNNK